MTKRGRKPGIKNGALKKHRGGTPRGLRFEYYSDMPSSKGGSVSGYADQFGRIMEIFINDKDSVDYRPTGASIAAKH